MQYKTVNKSCYWIFRLAFSCVTIVEISFFTIFRMTEILIDSWLLDCCAFISLFSSPLFHYASCIPATTQHKPAIPPTNVIVMQQLSVQSYSPLTSPNQSPLTKPYKNLCPGREQTAEYQSAPGAVFKKAGLCLNRDALFKRQLRGINRVNTWQGPTICSP